MRLISAICNFVEREFDDLELGPNPAKGIALNRETGRERFLRADELERLGEALDRAATVGLPYDVDETKPSAKHAPKHGTLDPEKRAGGGKRFVHCRMVAGGFADSECLTQTLHGDLR